MFLMAGFPAKAGNPDSPITVFAAASLTDTLPALAAAWHQSTGKPLPRFSFGPSAMMARQVAAGAPANIVLSANPEWIKFLEDRALLAAPPETVAHNRLVLVKPGSGQVTEQILTPELVVSLLGRERLAIADPAIAPAGAYARDYLQNIGLWDQLAGNLAMGSNVRQTLVLVERGGMTGFVYATDARASQHVDVLGRVPPAAIPPIAYAAGLTRRANKDADSFYRFLTSPEAAPIWQRFGFEPSVSK
jgi:molybdate transport system substrate-binding protein